MRMWFGPFLLENNGRVTEDMPNCQAPVEHRFSSTHQPKKNGRHKGRTCTDYLRKWSNTVISFRNPITGLPDKATVNEVVAIQLTLKATQDSDLPSIREYLDRLDGKVLDKVQHSGDITLSYGYRTAPSAVRNNRLSGQLT